MSSGSRNTVLDTTAAVEPSHHNHGLKEPTCNLCQVVFVDAQEQRLHMKEDWQYDTTLARDGMPELTRFSVLSLKRRLEALPPLSTEEYQSQTDAGGSFNTTDIAKGRRTAQDGPLLRRKQKSKAPQQDLNDVSDDEAARQSPEHGLCLFCDEAFEQSDGSVDDTIQHMLTAHDFTIPDADLVTDMPTFLNYLSLVVREWHECLFCGTTRGSISGIQSHMKDTRHRKLNLLREPELLAFWDGPPIHMEAEYPGAGQEPQDCRAGELRLPTGKMVLSKDAACQTHKEKRRAHYAARARSLKLETTTIALASDDARPASTTTTLARRSELGLIGVPLQQRRVLAVEEKKAQRSEASSRRAADFATASSANSQKFDQLDNQHKWGKQQHKLLPR